MNHRVRRGVALGGALALLGGFACAGCKCKADDGAESKPGAFKKSGRRARKGLSGRRARPGRWHRGRWWDKRRRRRRPGFGGPARKLGPPRVKVRSGQWAVVTHVVDGDTLYVRPEAEGSGPGEAVRVRLAGINAPECRKDRVRLDDGRPSSACTADREWFGLEAYRVLKELVQDERVRVHCESDADGLCRRGNYGRYLLSLSVERGDVAQQMVSRGAAMAYTAYFHPALGRLCEAEDGARRDRQGMWKEKSPSEVLSLMSAKTRAWYSRRDERCRSLRRVVPRSSRGAVPRSLRRAVSRSTSR